MSQTFLEKIKELRERTGAGMLDCKKYLLQSSDDVLMDAEARFIWIRLGALKRKLKLPPEFRPGEAQVALKLPIRFRAH